MRSKARTARATMVAFLCVWLAPAAASQSGALDSVWKAQRITLSYRGSTTFYTCDLFERNVRLAMNVLGAHPHMLLDRSHCTSREIRLTVTFKSPIEADEKNLRELTTYSAQHELVARLNGVSLPSAADLQRFPAEWSEISFAGNPRLRLTASDCEFVDNLRRQLLPHIRVRVVSNRLFCSPGSLAIAGPKLRVVALVAQQSL